MNDAIQAAAFRRLLKHLHERSDVQNIDLMNLAGFCRNCLSRWVQEEAAASDVVMDKEGAREFVYGMPYAEWKAAHQTPATPGQLLAFKEKGPKDVS